MLIIGLEVKETLDGSVNPMVVVSIWLILVGLEPIMVKDSIVIIRFILVILLE